MRNVDQADIAGLVLEDVLSSYGTFLPAEAVAESIYHEQRRLEGEPAGRRQRDDAAFWDSTLREVRHADAPAAAALLQQCIRHYTREVRGNLDDRVYSLMARTLPPALGLLLVGNSPRRILTRGWRHGSLDDTIMLRGEVEALQRLNRIGTVILAPTHVSNLDSAVLGFAAHRLGLPPFVYGAGLNLFTNPCLGLFMHHLGCYTVDRRKTDPLYKTVLKSYATALMCHGYNNLFFPGGTRARSGALERHLKLGLLGTVPRAYVRNLQRGNPRPALFVVPATLSYQLVLEAETLIDDFLKEVGKARYIISDDEFSQPRRVFDFLSRLLELDSKIYINIGTARDPFGNAVDAQGRSLDPHGRPIDPRLFVCRAGEPVIDDARDMEYTREVGDHLARSYACDQVIQSTHVAARAAFAILRRRHCGLDLMRLIRAGGASRVGEAPEDSMPLEAVHRAVALLCRDLRALQGRGGIGLSPAVQSAEPGDIIADALRHFATYHRRVALRRVGDTLQTEARGLLFYYHNRLEGYALASESDLAPALDARHRALLGGSGAPVWKGAA